MIDNMKLKNNVCSLLSLGLALCLMLFCGKAPSDAPIPVTGSIKITARIDTMLVDSMSVIIDNVARGMHSNKCVFQNLEAGKHQVAVGKNDPESPIDFTSTPKFVAVNANETTDVTLALTKLAPDFTLKNLKNEAITLGSYRGKVVLLVFFSHT